MGGDLVSDGYASFWDQIEGIVIETPELRNKLVAFLQENERILISRKPRMY